MAVQDQFEVITALKGELLRLKEGKKALEAAFSKSRRRENDLKRTIDRVKASRDGAFSEVHPHPARCTETALNIADRKLYEAARSRLASIVESSEVAIISLTLDGIILTWNRGAEKLYGYSAETTLGRPYSFLVASGQTDPLPSHSKKIAKGACVAPYETIVRGEDGRLFNILGALSPIRDDRNAISGISVIAYDITARKSAETALKAANERLHSTLASITDGYLKLGTSWEFLEMNSVAEKIFGRAEDVLGKVCWQRYPQAVGSEFYMQIHKATQKGHPVHFESQSIISGKWYETHAYPRTDGIEIYFRDISDRKRFEEEIKHLAYHDLLTGLPNKKLLIDLFRMELAHARRNRQKIAILFLDLDGFKEINDRFGHAAGDLLLKEVSDRLKRRMRGADIVSRVGGDEFNIILPNVTDSADAATISRKLIEDLNKPIRIYGNELLMTASIGISIFPDDSEDIDTLCRYADIAMYQAKQHVRNTYAFHNPSLNTKNIVRIRMENRLKQALKNNELVLFYQPQLIFGPQAVRCAEVLLRWQHPEDGLLTPDRFLGLAEETGMIIAIGQWVLLTACEQNMAWQAAGYPRICLSVNLSDREFHDSGLPESTRQILHQTGLDPNLLEYEIIEGIAMRDIDFTFSTFRQLIEIGVRLSLDDFGTGFSCLNFLARLPLHKLKIDRSFLRNMGDDSSNSAIIHAATTLARELNIIAVAEGVETEAEMKALRKYNCTNIQGHLLSKPLPADQFEHQVLRTRYPWKTLHAGT